MSFASEPHYEYQAGGSLPPDAPTYIARQADASLYRAVMQRDYCYVLNARQMGKSSLRIRTMIRLLNEGVACTEVELSGIGSQEITASQWYGGLIQEIASGLGLRFKPRQWLKEREHLSPVQSLRAFIETVVLVQIDSPIVIFFDEIDSILSLKFSTDEFFSLIRNFYDRRAKNRDYHRLSFVFLGVATPAELVREKGYSTPFNVGTAIDLQGFKIEDCGPLFEGLQHLGPEPSTIIETALEWTGGQPFLTQKVCSILAHLPSQGSTAESLVENVIRTQILRNWESQDEPEHLRTIRDRLLRNASNTPQLLRLYRKILKNSGVLYRFDSQEQLELRLSGLVEIRHGKLVVKNQIYQQVFNLAWIEEQLGEHEGKILAAKRIPAREARPAFWRWLMTSLLATLSIMGLRSINVLSAWELQAYDQLMRLRPQEPADPRLFLIQITEEDVQAQPAETRGGVSLSDATLSQLLQKLESARPRTIGFDIYREHSAKAPDLAKRLGQGQAYFICQYGQPGVPSSPDLPEGFAGFNNTPLDADGVVRRQILSVDEAEPCASNLAFSLRLAERYLYAEGLSLNVNERGWITFGTSTIMPLQQRPSYLQGNLGGYQLLLNYRATASVAQSATLGEVLSDSFEMSQLRDRLILVGTVAPSFNDHRWFVPHDSSPVSGMEIQAHMTSQLLSAVLDQRSLIQLWPSWGEWFWVGGWSMVLLLSFRGGQLWRLGGRVLGLLLLLTGSSLLLLIHGFWVPLVPAVMSGGLSIIGVKLQSKSNLRSIAARDLFES